MDVFKNVVGIYMDVEEFHPQNVLIVGLILDKRNDILDVGDNENTMKTGVVCINLLSLISKRYTQSKSLLKKGYP